MRSILCAFDFSKQSESALITSYTISKAMNTEFHVVYFISSEVLGLSTPDVEKSEKEKKITEFLNSKGINAKIHVQIAKEAIPIEILKLAKEIDAGMIAVGRSGYDISEASFIGSNTLSLKKISEIPLLIGTYKAKDTIKNILVTLNEKSYSLDPLSFAIKLSKNTDAKLHLLNVIESPYPVPVEERELQEAKVRQNIKDYELFLKEVEYSLNIIVSENASKGILDYASDNQIDIIMMSRKKSLNLIERLLYSSTSLRILRGTIVPVILF